MNFCVNFIADVAEKWERRASPHRAGVFVRADSNGLTQPFLARADSEGVTGKRISLERKAAENTGVKLAADGK